MTNINPNNGVGKINDIIKKESKVNKEKKVVAETKQVEASALNALGAYGLANVNFKGSIARNFEEEIKEFNEKVKLTFGGEDGVLSAKEIDDIQYEVNENNIDLAKKLLFAKKADGSEIIDNKKLIPPILEIAKNMPELAQVVIKKDDNENISIDIDAFYNEVYQVLKQENDELSEEVNVDFIKQILEFKNEKGKYSYNFNEAMDIISLINSENIDFAKKLIFNKDEKGKQLFDINSYLENYNLQNPYHNPTLNIPNILSKINSENVEFAERLLYGKDFPQKEYISRLIEPATKKTIPLLKKLIFSEKPIMPLDELLHVVKALNDENADFAEELFFAKDKDGKDLFPDKKHICTILSATNPVNIDIAKALCLTGDSADEEKIAGIANVLRNISEDNLPMAKTIIANKIEGTPPQMVRMLKSNSEEEATLKDLLMFGKDGDKDIFPNKSQILPFVSSITNSNYDLVHKMFLAKDKEGKKLFTDSEQILNISNHTYSNKRKLCEILCFGKDNEGNELLPNKEVIPQILSKAGCNIDVADLEKYMSNPDIMKNENCSKLLFSVLDAIYLTYDKKYMFNKFFSTPTWYKNEYLQKNIWNMVNDNNISMENIQAREAFIDTGFDCIANSESKDIQKTFERLLYWVKTPAQALVAEKILSDPLLYENKSVQDACRNIIEYISDEKSAKAKIEFLDKYLNDSKYNTNEFLSASIGYFASAVNTSEKAKIKFGLIDIIVSSPEMLKNEKVKNNFYNTYYMIETPEQLKIANKFLSEPILHSGLVWDDTLKNICSSCKNEDDLKIKLSVIDKYLNEETKPYEDKTLSQYIYSTIQLINNEEELNIFDKLTQDKNLLGNTELFGIYYNILTNKNEEQKELQLKFFEKLISNSILYENRGLNSYNLKMIIDKIQTKEDLDIKLSLMDKYVTEPKLHENESIALNLHLLLEHTKTEEELKNKLDFVDKYISEPKLYENKDINANLGAIVFYIRNEEDLKTKSNFVDKYISDETLQKNEELNNNFGRILAVVNSTNKDFAFSLCFGKDNKDIFENKSLVAKILMNTKGSNLSLAEKLCYGKDDNGKELFLNKELIADILEHTNAENIDLSMKLCLGKNEDNKELFEDKDEISKILSQITLGNKAFAEKLCFGKDNKGRELFADKNLVSYILNSVTPEKISFAEKLCYGKDNEGKELFTNKKLISYILNRVTPEKISFAEKLCYGKDDEGKELFLDKEAIIEILSSVNAKNIDNATKLCFGKNVDSEDLFPDKKLIAYILSNDLIQDDSKSQLAYDALYNKKIGCVPFINILEGKITIDEFEETIKTLDDIDSQRLNAKEFSEVNNRDKLNNLSAENLVFVVKNSKLYGKNNINEISLKDKKTVLRNLMNQNINLFNIRDELRQDFPLIPKNADEYCTLLKSLVKSMGIQTNEITLDQEQKFDNATINLGQTLSKLSDEDFNSLKIEQEFSKDEFIENVLTEIEGLSSLERQKVYDYFGFEIKPYTYYSKDVGVQNRYTIVGYPVNLNNGEKLSQIDDVKTKQVVEQLRPLVIKFSENNKIKSNNKVVETILNEIASVLPEIRTFIGKAQHGTQDFDIMKHSLKVMQKIVQNPKFNTLDDRDKKIILLASLLHDSAKSEGNVDPIHAKESAFDAFYISQKFNLTKDERIKLYSLIEQHEWLADINKTKNDEEKEKQLKSKAFDLQYDNLFELSKIFTEADLKAVKNSDKFFDRFKNDFEVISQEVDSLISTLKTSQPLLPVTPLPKASRIKEAITVVDDDDYSTNLPGVYVDENGMVIIKYKEVENETWEKIGFPKGTISKDIKHTVKVFDHMDNTKKEPVFKDQDIDTGNIHFFVHGLEYANQLSNFDAFALPNSDALLSVSYAERPESKYRFFRSQGVILNTDAKYMHGGGETDSGSGYGKNIDEFKTNYAYEGSKRHTDRTFISELIKTELGLKSDQEYIDLISEYKNKPFTDIQPKELQEKIIKALSKINSHIRNGDRSYNEMYISNPDIMGYFVYDWDDNVGKIKEFVSNDVKVLPFIKQNAVENDMPLIVFGK